MVVNYQFDLDYFKLQYLLGRIQGDQQSASALLCGHLDHGRGAAHGGDDQVALLADGPQGLDPLILNDLGREAGADDLLGLRLALRLDALAFGFLLLLQKHELHLLGFLVGRDLVVDGLGDLVRQEDP